VKDGALVQNTIGLPAMEMDPGGSRMTAAASLSWPMTLYAWLTGIEDSSYRLVWSMNEVGCWLGKTPSGSFYLQGGIESFGGAVTTEAQLVSYVLASEPGNDVMLVDGYVQGSGGSGDNGSASAITWGDQSESGGASWAGSISELIIFNIAHDGSTLGAVGAALTP
jgi:hypothetical protein